MFAFRKEGWKGDERYYKKKALPLHGCSALHIGKNKVKTGAFRILNLLFLCQGTLTLLMGIDVLS